MYVRFASAALAALTLMFVAATPVRASELLVIPASFEFTDISLEGTGSVPLGAKPPGNEWTFVDAMLDISTSSSIPSLLMLTFETEYTVDADGMIVSFDRLGFDLSASLFLDITFEEVDSTNGFGGGLGPIISLPASSDKPLEVSLNLSATLEQLSAVNAYLECGSSNWSKDSQGKAVCNVAAIPGATVQEAVDDYNASHTDQIIFTFSDSVVTYPLNADLGGGPSNDVLEFSGAGVMLATLAGVLTIDNLMTGGTIDGVGFTFGGDILDADADPPFTVDLTGSITLSPAALVAVPAPASVLLLTLGFVVFEAARRRREFRG